MRACWVLLLSQVPWPWQLRLMAACHALCSQMEAPAAVADPKYPLVSGKLDGWLVWKVSVGKGHLRYGFGLDLGLHIVLGRAQRLGRLGGGGCRRGLCANGLVATSPRRQGARLACLLLDPND